MRFASKRLRHIYMEKWSHSIMNSKIIWTDQVPEKDGVKNPINDISISPGATDRTFSLIYAILD